MLKEVFLVVAIASVAFLGGFKFAQTQIEELKTQTEELKTQIEECVAKYQKCSLILSDVCKAYEEYLEAKALSIEETAPNSSIFDKWTATARTIGKKIQRWL